MIHIILNILKYKKKNIDNNKKTYSLAQIANVAQIEAD